MILLPVILVAGNKLHSLGNLEAVRLTSYPPASRYSSTEQLKHLWADAIVLVHSLDINTVWLPSFLCQREPQQAFELYKNV